MQTIQMDPAAGGELLRTIRLLKDLPDTALAALSSEVRWISTPKKEAVISHLAGDASVFFLATGKCRLSLTTPTGRGMGFRDLGPGAHFGEIAALTGAPRTLNVTAIQDCVLAECPQAVFLSFMERYPAFGATVAISLARMVAELTERMFELGTLALRFRLYGELLRLAKQGTATPDGVLIKGAPTQDAIASTIGAGREPVAKEFGFLKSEGLLVQRGRELLIRDIDELRRLMQERSGVAVSHVTDWPF